MERVQWQMMAAIPTVPPILARPTKDSTIPHQRRGCQIRMGGCFAGRVPDPRRHLVPFIAEHAYEVPLSVAFRRRCSIIGTVNAGLERTRLLSCPRRSFGRTSNYNQSLCGVARSARNSDHGGPKGGGPGKRDIAFALHPTLRAIQILLFQTLLKAASLWVTRDSI